MIDLFTVAARVQRSCDEAGFESCFIGGVALQRYGEARVTRDVDVALFTGFGGEERVARVMLSAFAPRIPDALQFALEHRVLLLELDGIGIDVSLAALPYEHEMIARASAFEMLPGLFLRTCSAEDLVVLKCFASRQQDWIDVENVLARQASLDWDYIVPRLTELAALKEDPQIVARLLELRANPG